MRRLVHAAVMRTGRCARATLALMLAVTGWAAFASGLAFAETIKIGIGIPNTTTNTPPGDAGFRRVQGITSLPVHTNFRSEP
jgi:hypothetical protein